MAARQRLMLAHALSFSRVALAPLAAWSLWADCAMVSALVFAWVVCSDVLDGRVARSRGETTPRGTLVDHGADAVFVTVMTATAAALGLLPVALPIVIAIAFLAYAGGRRRLRPSRLGRANGLAYYGIVAATLWVRHAGSDGGWPHGLYAAGWLLVLSSLLSLATRWWQRAPGPPSP